MQPFVETESEDEMDTSAALNTGEKHDKEAKAPNLLPVLSSFQCRHKALYSRTCRHVNSRSSDCHAGQMQRAAKP